MVFPRSKSFDLQGQDVPWWTSCRLSICVLCFFAALSNYAMRTNMSVAIVCMVNSTSEDGVKNTTSFQPDSSLYGKGEFNWSSSEEGWVLSAFYVGYILTQMPGGILSTRYGAKIVLGWSMFLLSLITLVTAPAARLSVYLLMLVQALKGFVSGVYYPCFYQLLGRWAPVKERSILLSFSASGIVIGTVVSSAMSGYLCDHGFDGGWPSIFYVFGMVGLLWCVFWYFMAYSSPEQHPRISQAELEYIQESLPSNDPKALKVPWSSLLTTWPVYGIFMTDTCYAWGFYVSVTYVPQYMNDVLKIDIQSNGLYSALPSLCNAVVAVSGGVLADFIVRKQLLKLTLTRKVLQTLGSLPSAALAIGVAYLTSENKALAITLVTLWGGLTAFVNSGSYSNVVDMAPVYSGIIMGIDNTLSTISGILVPPVTSAMTKNGTVEEWRNVFFLAAAIPITGWIVYMILGDATERDWAEVNLEDTKNIRGNGGKGNLAFIEMDELAQDSSYKR